MERRHQPGLQYHRLWLQRPDCVVSCFALTAICIELKLILPPKPSHTMQCVGSGVVKQLKGHIDPVLSVAISPDGMTIVSGSGNPYVFSTDNTVR